MVTTQKQPLNVGGLYHRPSNEITHNARVELYPLAGVSKLTYSRDAVFKEPGWEDDRPGARVDFAKGKAGEDTRMDSIRRAKKRIFQYAMLNHFEYFVTWTLNAALIDRYDPKEVSAKMRTFLRNAVQRKNLRYILVPELHKDGAIHAHGFVSGDFTMIDSGKKDKAGRKIYNVQDWKYGFTTAVKIDGDYEKASYYITKYIEKADKMIFGNFYYAGGKGLERKPETLLFDVRFDEIEAQEYECKETGNAFKYESAGRDSNGD